MKREKIIVKKQKVVIKSKLYSFTFIMNYLGGTYIEQVSSSNEINAMRVWIKCLKISEVKGFTTSDREKILKANFDGDIPVPINRVKNVWFFSVETKEGYGHVNIIKTFR